MIEIKCYVCGDELTKPGGLLFSPANEFDECTKTHLCIRCYDLTYKTFLTPLRSKIIE